jgi:hypothetical protein
MSRKLEVKSNKNQIPANKQTITEFWEKFLKNRILQFVLLLIISATFYVNSTATFDRKLNLNGDNIYYFSLGKALSEGKGYTNIMSFEETPHTHFPPGYPVFLSGLMKIYPNNIIAAKVTNELLLWLSLIVLFLLLKKLSGNIMVAFISCLLCSVNRDLLNFSTMMMSEILYLFTTVSAIYLALIVNERKLFMKKEILNNILFLLLTIVVVYIYFVRSIGTSLVLSIVFWTGILALQSMIKWIKSVKNKDAEGIKSNKQCFIQQIIVCLVLTCSMVVAISLWHNRNEKAGVTGMSYSDDFMKKADGKRMSTMEDWTTRIKSNATNYITSWIPNMVFFTQNDIRAEKTTKQWVTGILILLTMIAGLTAQKKGGLLLVFYMGATMAVMLLYYEEYQGARYCLAIIPFFIFLFLCGLAKFLNLLVKLFSQKLQSGLLQDAVVLVFSVIVMFPASVNAQQELRQIAKFKTWEDVYNPPMNQYLEAVKWSGKNLPDTARVLCRKPELFYMFSGNRPAGSFPFYAEIDTVMDIFTKNKITHVIIDSWFRHAYYTIYPAIVQYPEKFKLIRQIGKNDATQQITPTLIFEFNPEWGYYGERQNGMKTGDGYEVFQNGSKYIGHFSQNAPDGYGEYYDEKGELLAKGLWKNGALVKPQ